jgi:hypothetical protein
MFNWIRSNKSISTNRTYFCKDVLPEEDISAVKQNNDEVEFNKTNPTHNQRIKNAKNRLLKNWSLDKKCDVLYYLNVNESMEESFMDIDKNEER